MPMYRKYVFIANRKCYLIQKTKDGYLMNERFILNDNITSNYDSNELEKLQKYIKLNDIHGFHSNFLCTFEYFLN